MKQNLTILVLLLAQLNVFAQELLHKNYNGSDGLASNECYFVHKDKTGFIWTCTDMGVSRFDGVRFENFTTKDGLGDNVIFKMTEDRLGRLWFMGYNGKITLYENHVFKVLPCSDFLFKKYSALLIIDFVVDSNFNLLFTYRHEKTIFKIKPPYRETNIEQIKIGGAQSAFVKVDETTGKYHPCKCYWTDNGEMLMFKYFDSGLNTLDSICINASELNIKKEMMFTSVSIVTKDYLCLTYANCLIIKERANKKCHVYSFQDRLLCLSYNNEANSLLIGYANTGIDELEFKNWKLKKLINETSATRIIENNNEIWYGTQKDGLGYVPNKNYRQIYSGNKNITSLIALSPDSLFLLNEQGDFMFNGELIRKGNFLQKTRYSNLLLHNNRIYLSGTSACYYDLKTNGLNYFLDTHDTLKKWGFDEYLSTRGGHFYAVSYNHLLIFTETHQFIKKIKIPHGRITKIKELNNKLYVGTDRGLLLLEKGTFINSPGTSDFLKKKIVDIDVFDQYNLLLTSKYDGIALYNTNTKTVSIINTASGLPSNFITHAAVDENKLVWISFGNGLASIRITNKEKYFITNYSQLNFLNTEKINTINFLKDQLLLSIGNTVLLLNKNHLSVNNVLFPLIIHKCVVGKDTIRHLKNKDTVMLTDNQNDLKIDFQLLAYNTFGSFEYQYSINSNTWRKTIHNTVELASLPPGNYSIEVQGRPPNGIWSKSLVIYVNKPRPWYLNPWLFILLMLIVVVIAYLSINTFLKNRYKRKLKDEYLNRRIEQIRLTALRSQMNPHFIFNSINSVQNFILKNESIDAYKYLTDFSKLIRKYLEHSNKDIILLKEEIETLELYLSLEQLRVQFNYTIQVESDIDTNNLNVYSLLLQPFIENAIWHGLSNKKGERNILLTFRIQKQKTIVTLEDNGIGRKKSTEINRANPSKSKSYALSNITNRINSLNNIYAGQIEYTVTDKTDIHQNATGTKIEISFKNIIGNYATK